MKAKWHDDTLSVQNGDRREEKRFAYLIGGVLLNDSLDFDGGVGLFAGRTRWLLIVGCGRFEAVLIGGLIGGRAALLLLLHPFGIGRIENARVSLHVTQIV